MYTALDLHVHISGGMAVHGRHFANFGIEEADFADGDFEGAVFTKVSFTKCNFSEASFKHAFFEECCFVECDLEGTDFESIQTDGLNIGDCPMEGASFDLADLTGFCLWGSTGRLSFKEADFDKQSSIIQCTIWESDFAGATVDESLFMDSDLSDSTFSATTYLKYVTFLTCDLTNTWAYMTRGGDTCEYQDCFALPFCHRKFQTTSFPMGDKLPNKDVSLAPYKNVSTVAHLYCSDLEEFRKTK